MSSWQSYASRAVFVFCIAAASVSTGCSTLVNAGLAELTDGERRGVPGAGPPVDAAAGAAGRARQTTSAYQVAPTHDWRASPFGDPWTPAHSIFGQVGHRRVSCQAVPVGLAQVYSGPSGPAGTPLLDLGPLDIGVAGPDGVAADVLALDAQALTTRAFRSGVRLAGNGPVCGHRLFLYARLGTPTSPVVVHR